MRKQKDELSVVIYEKQEPIGEVPCGIKRVEYIGDGGKINYYFPALTSSAYNNLYGRIMTLLEATTDHAKLKVVKTLFQRELNDYFDNLEKSVKEVDERNSDDMDPRPFGYMYKNVYVYPKGMGRIIRGDDPQLNEIDI